MVRSTDKNEPNLEPDLLVRSWLDCPSDYQQEWLIHHQRYLTLSFLEAMKLELDKCLREKPAPYSEEIAKAMLQIAKLIPDEPLAMPLASWARGNSLVYHNPQASIAHYRRAIDGYREVEREEIALVPLSNLLYAMTETNPVAAWHMYRKEIEPWLLRLRKNQAKRDCNYRNLLRIEQNLGYLLSSLGNYQEALKVYQRSLSLAQTYGLDDRVAEAQDNIATTLAQMGLLHECEQFILDGYNLALRTSNLVAAARMTMNLGILYSALGRVNEALTRFQEARKQFNRLDNLMETGSVVLWEAYLLQRIGALKQARQNYEMAKNHFQNLEMIPQVWQATIEEAATARRYGLYGQADNLLGEAEQIWQEQQQPSWQSEWMLENAALYLAKGQLELAQRTLKQWPLDIPSYLITFGRQAQYNLLCGELYEQMWLRTKGSKHQQNAKQFYQAAIDYAEKQGELQMQRASLAGVGRLLRYEKPNEAKGLLLEAAERDDLIRAALTLQELKASFLHQNSDVLETLLSWAIKDNEPEEALQLSWRSKGNGLLDLLNQSFKETSDDESEQALQSARNRLAALRWQAAIEANQRQIPQSIVEEEMSEIGILENRLVELRRQRIRESEKGADETFNISSHLAHMNADVLIEYVSVQNELIAIVVDRMGRCRIYQLTDIDTILELLDEMTLAFQSVLTLPLDMHIKASTLVESRQLLANCYDLLVKPLDLPDNAARLLIAPCVPLHRVPFAALWDGSSYWVEQYTIELIPTGGLLAADEFSHKMSAPLVISSTANGALVANRDQAEAIAKKFPQATCLVDTSHPIKLLNDLEYAPQFLHIAAHTLIRDDMPLFTSLQLADTTLSVEECYDLSLRGTELVVLSSCTTAAGMESAGTLLAFQSAFFTAGVRRVISTLWEIQSELSCYWMNIFYAELITEPSPVDALHQTQLALLQSEAHCHPVHWAAFSCSRR